VVRAFPALAAVASVAVIRTSRLHMHFGQPARCFHSCACACALLASRAWSQQPQSCDREGYNALEMLAFACHPAREAGVLDGAQLMQRVEELVRQE
jgi:hypothetical protein